MWPGTDTSDAETMNSSPSLSRDGCADTGVLFKESGRGDSISEFNYSRVSYGSDNDNPKSKDVNGGQGGQTSGDRIDSTNRKGD
jgi:hypothetical protein